MIFTKKALFSAFIGMSVSLSAYADINVTNNTNAYATAKISGVCSSIVNDKGVISPHSSAVIPQVVFDLYCPMTCEADIFMTKNCSGKAISTVKISHNDGVISHKNYGVDGYHFEGIGKYVSIEGGPTGN